MVDATLRHEVSAEERPQVEAAIADGKVVQPPAGTEGRGDALVISIAEEVGGVIISNDNFAPFQKAGPWLRNAGRVLGATHSQGVWVFNRRVPNAAVNRVSQVRILPGAPRITALTWGLSPREGVYSASDVSSGAVCVSGA